MTKIFASALFALRKINLLLRDKEIYSGRNWKAFSNKNYANDLIKEMLLSEEPFMIARFGATELNALMNYLGVTKFSSDKNKYKMFIEGKIPPWWWENKILHRMKEWSGFYPSTVSGMERFCKLMIEDMKHVDLLGHWRKEENFFANHLSEAKKVVLEDIEPFFSENPWTKALENKKVLVVHPFAKTIERQYKKRDKLFSNQFLPSFDLKCIQAVQSLGGDNSQFKDWFEALQYMKDEIDKNDYDVCIIGCGAYGFPLAAHVKRKDKKAIHLAGVTQMLFGIRGKRWEEYIVWPYENLFNEHWVRPGLDGKPKNAQKVEGACYW